MNKTDPSRVMFMLVAQVAEQFDDPVSVAEAATAAVAIGAWLLREKCGDEHMRYVLAAVAEKTPGLAELMNPAAAQAAMH